MEGKECYVHAGLITSAGWVHSLPLISHLCSLLLICLVQVQALAPAHTHTHSHTHTPTHTHTLTHTHTHTHTQSSPLLQPPLLHLTARVAAVQCWANHWHQSIAVAGEVQPVQTAPLPPI